MSEDRGGTPVSGDEDLAALDDILDLDADPEAEAPREEVEQVPDEPARPAPQTREERRVNALRERERELKEENRRLRADFDRMLAQSRAPAPAAPDPYRQAEMQRLEAERLAMMAPHEQQAYHTQKVEQMVNERLLRAELTTADRLDRQNFAQLQRDEPAARRLAQEVEDGLILARQNNMNPTREAIYNVLIGQEVRNRMKQQTEKQRARGRQQIARETTRPGSTSSTAPAPRRGEQKRSEDLSEAELLERIGDMRI